MAGMIAEQLEADGYRCDGVLDAALPMPIWKLDLELERHRNTTAAELAVLRLVEAGEGVPGRICALLGLGADGRLVEQVLGRLLGGLAIEPKGDRFIATTVGRSWIADGGRRARERVTFDVRLDPVRDAFEWMDFERPAYATADSWTIELPGADANLIQSRKIDIARLVRDSELPDEADRPRREQRPPVELRSFAIADTGIHWRPVRLDVWRHPDRTASALVAHIADAENPALTAFLEFFVARPENRTLVRAN